MPMFHSSMSDLCGSILGFLATPFESNKSSKGVKPFGKKLSLRFNISDSSSIISSISTFSKLSISDWLNLVGLANFTLFTSIFLKSISLSKSWSMVQSVYILQFWNSPHYSWNGKFVGLVKKSVNIWGYLELLVCVLLLQYIYD